MPSCDLALLERWLTGWSRSRGLALPYHDAGGLTVDVNLPDQMRRHVFADAGAALQQCAAAIDAPFIYLKAAVHADVLRRALPERWTVEAPRYLMRRDGPMAPSRPLPSVYSMTLTVEHGAYLMRIMDGQGVIAASGRIALDAGTAVFDRIATHEDHRRRGLASALMLSLDRLAVQAGITERLLSATEAGATLYTRLGWQHISPYASACLKIGSE